MIHLGSAMQWVLEEIERTAREMQDGRLEVGPVVLFTRKGLGYQSRNMMEIGREDALRDTTSGNVRTIR